MFGKNVLRKADPTDGGSLSVKEVFHTLQGEGPFAGAPAVFVRLAGCNLRCHFCDTDFEGEGVRTVDAESLVSLVTNLWPHQPRKGLLVVITGGEPLRQNIGYFCDLLLDLGYMVQVETAGTIWPLHSLSSFVHLVCSPKTGGLNPIVRDRCQHWKYIVGVGDELDEHGLPMSNTQVLGGKLQRLGRGDGTVWIQPRYEYHNNDIKLPHDAVNRRNVEFAKWICLNYGHRLSLQQHKILDLP